MSSLCTDTTVATVHDVGRTAAGLLAVRQGPRPEHQHRRGDGGDGRLTAGLQPAAAAGELRQSRPRR